MRSPVLLLAALSVLACDRADTMSCRVGCLTTSPPEPVFIGQTHVIPVAGGLPNLQVSVSLTNATSTTFAVSQCPLVIHFFPYPGPTSTSASDACSAGAPVRRLAPGDTSVMTRVLSADTLASFPPGQYNVDVSVTFQDVARSYGAVAGFSAGIVQLPLGSTSP